MSRKCTGTKKCAVPGCSCPCRKPARAEEFTVCACCLLRLSQRERTFLYFHHASRPTCWRGKPWTVRDWLKDVFRLLQTIAIEKAFERSEAARAEGDAE